MKLTLLILSIFIVGCFCLFAISTIVTGFLDDRKYNAKHNWSEDILILSLVILIFGSFFYIGYYLGS